MSIDFEALGDPYADVKGHVLELESGIVVVPYQADEDGWMCVVVRGIERYLVGEYNIFVSHDELKQGARLTEFRRGES